MKLKSLMEKLTLEEDDEEADFTSEVNNKFLMATLIRHSSSLSTSPLHLFVCSAIYRVQNPNQRPPKKQN